MKITRLQAIVLASVFAAAFMAFGGAIAKRLEQRRVPLAHAAGLLIAGAEPAPFGPSTDVGQLLDCFRASTFAAATAIRGPARLTPQQAAAFADAARAQLARLVPASYDEYRAGASAYKDVRPASFDGFRLLMIYRRGEWMRHGVRHVIPVDPSVVHVKPRLLHGEQVRSRFDENLGYAPVRVGSLDLQRVVESQATIYEVLLPADIDDPFQPHQRITIVLAIALTLEPDGRWTPSGIGHVSPGERLRHIDHHMWTRLLRTG